MSINGLNSNISSLLNNDNGKSLLKKMGLSDNSIKVEDLTSKKLAELLKNPPEITSEAEQKIYDELKGIDKELSSIEDEFAKMREEERLDLVKARALLDRLREIEGKLEEINGAINDIIESRKARDKMNRIIYNQFNQIDLLRVQAEKYREMNEVQNNNPVVS